MLIRSGFVNHGGKGSHSNWYHPRIPGLRITLSGKDGSDARHYHEVKVNEAIRQVEQP
jgi:hypothetical protein